MSNEEAIKIIEEMYIHWLRLQREHICEKEEGEKVINALLLSSKALKNERLQGKWITVYFISEELNVPQKASKFDFVKCPFCETIHQGRHHFCSWCGADMREADNDK